MTSPSTPETRANLRPWNIRRYGLLFTLLGSVFLYGCAGPKKATDEQLAYYDLHAELLRSRPSSLIVDSCLLRDEIGQDYILVQATEESALHAIESIGQVLTANGIQVSKSVFPFLCGLAKSEDGSDPFVFKAVQEQGEEPQDQEFPVLRMDELNSRPRLAEAYRNLISTVYRELPSINNLSLSRLGQETPLSMDAEEVALLRQALGTDYVWLLQIGGVQVSAGKTISTALLTSALSLAVSNGTFAHATMLTGGNGFDIVLLDLERRSLIWKKRWLVDQGDPVNLNLYSMRWAQTLFSPLMSLTPAVRQPTMQPEEILDTTDAMSLRIEAQALYAGRVNDRTIMDALAQKLWIEQYSEDGHMIDAMAWFCRVLGQSGDGRYRPLLVDIGMQTNTRKLRRYSEQAVERLPQDGATPFVPDTDREI